MLSKLKPLVYYQDNHKQQLCHCDTDPTTCTPPNSQATVRMCSTNESKLQSYKNGSSTYL